VDGWVVVIQKFAYEGERPCARGHNTDTCMQVECRFKFVLVVVPSWSPRVVRGHDRKKHIIFFPRTSGPISIKLGTNHPWVMRIANCPNEGPVHIQREIITKMQQWGTCEDPVFLAHLS
jgi:hypothetical protein